MRGWALVDANALYLSVRQKVSFIRLCPIVYNSLSPHLLMCLAAAAAVSLLVPLSVSRECLTHLQLAKEFEKGIPADESILVPRLRELLITEFGATPKAAAATAGSGAPPAAAAAAGAGC